jgi:D-glycero-alpha-D-manno-heptose-7-phosphate kinase
MESLTEILKKNPILASAPCRLDMGGTLDIATFYHPLRHCGPLTFNMALTLRTRVRLEAYRPGWVRITSRGFDSAEFEARQAPFRHPLGLMFAVAAYFRAAGVHIVIESQSPPRSALGGSSVAAVALTAAFLSLRRRLVLTPSLRRRIAMLAHAIEESVAGVPCGRQDQLAAAYGGVNAWHWRPEPEGFAYRRQVVVTKRAAVAFRRHILVAYCGVPHASADINGRWVRQFVAGRHRRSWEEIVDCTKKFVDAVGRKNYKWAVSAMNRETALRRELTPDVLDALGEKLVGAAVENGCGARFTGAGGGGCLWALGEAEDIDRLGQLWKEIVGRRKAARLLDAAIDVDGLVVEDNR